eukprot:2021539-Rhodomonas_salina.4
MSGTSIFGFGTSPLFSQHAERTVDLLICKHVSLERLSAQLPALSCRSACMSVDRGSAWADEKPLALEVGEGRWIVDLLVTAEKRIDLSQFVGKIESPTCPLSYCGNCRDARWFIPRLCEVLSCAFGGGSCCFLGRHPPSSSKCVPSQYMSVQNQGLQIEEFPTHQEVFASMFRCLPPSTLPVRKEHTSPCDAGFSALEPELRVKRPWRRKLVQQVSDYATSHAAVSHPD